MSFFAKKSLGQNFLTSESALNRIVEAGNISPQDLVLEIGPGRGALTQKLLEAEAQVIAIEKDRRLLEDLENKFRNEIKSKQLTLIGGDILEFDLSEILSENYKIIANIPYYITGEILRQFLSGNFQPKQMVLLVQKEVSERIVAQNRKESILSVSVKAYGNPKKIAIVKAGSFYPKPKVDSAIISIENISKGNFEDKREEDLFFSLVKTGFSNKRKQLHKNLKNLFIEPQKILIECGIDPHTRAEDLSLQNWKCLTKKKYQLSR